MLYLVFAWFYLLLFAFYVYFEVFEKDNHDFGPFGLWFISLFYLITYSIDLYKLSKSKIDYESEDGAEKFTAVDTPKALKTIHQPVLMILMVLICLIISFFV